MMSVERLLCLARHVPPAQSSQTRRATMLVFRAHSPVFVHRRLHPNSNESDLGHVNLITVYSRATQILPFVQHKSILPSYANGISIALRNHYFHNSNTNY